MLFLLSMLIVAMGIRDAHAQAENVVVEAAEPSERKSVEVIRIEDGGVVVLEPEIREILFAPVKVTTPPRPRLFITPSELAGLRRRIRDDPVFRSRYKQLEEEADRELIAACLLALISGEAKDVALAKRMLLATAAKGASGNIYGTSDRFAALCAGFDWLYDHLAAGERERVGRAILDFAKIYDKRPRQPDWANQMYELRSGCLLAGIVLVGSGIDDELARRLVRDYAKLLKQSLIPAQRMMNGTHGGMIDGTGYWFRTIAGYGRLLEAWRTYSGEDLFSVSGTQGVANWVLRTAQPHNDVFINWHDNSWQRNLWKSDAASLLQLFVKRNRDPIAKSIVQRGRVPAWKRLLWDDPDVEPADLSTLPLHCHHDGIGMVTMRSGWNRDATFAAFVSGDFVGYHDWPSANIFYISKQGSLAVDASIYDNRRRMFGQHIPADSHNTVLIGRGPRMKGQASRWTELGKGSKFDICDISTYEIGENYVYTVGDATRAYGGEARRFFRHVLFLLPDTFVIYDSIQANDARTPVRWLIHGVKRPVLDPQARRMTFTDGTGRLLVRTLLPREVRYVEDIGSYSGNGHTGFGVAVESARSAQDMEFLHVLHCGATPFSASLDGRRGVRITAGGTQFRVVFDSQAPRLLKSKCQGLVETAAHSRGKR